MSKKVLRGDLFPFFAILAVGLLLVSSALRACKKDAIPEKGEGDNPASVPAQPEHY